MLMQLVMVFRPDGTERKKFLMSPFGTKDHCQPRKRLENMKAQKSYLTKAVAIPPSTLTMFPVLLSKIATSEKTAFAIS